MLAPVQRARVYHTEAGVERDLFLAGIVAGAVDVELGLVFP